MSFMIGEKVWVFDGANRPVLGTVKCVHDGDVKCEIPHYDNMSKTFYPPYQVFRCPQDMEKLSGELIHRAHEMMRNLSQIINDAGR